MGGRVGGVFIIGLVRVELVLEEARELELRWSLCFEGCLYSSSSGYVERNKGIGLVET